MTGEVREAVREHYARLARGISSSACCGDGGCCSPGESSDGGAAPDAAYSPGQLQEVGLEAGVSLGCGNPTLLADLRPGQVVLDLGSGGGLDVLLSARRVAPGGQAYGVDMTDEMLELAERNRAQAGIDNATFLKGTIERVPLPDRSVDVVISNCVINLAEDKGAVLREAARVLRSDGLLAVADMVRIEDLAPDVQQTVDAWAGCIAGSIPVDDYRSQLGAAGFDEVGIEVHAEHQLEGGGRIGSAYIRARRTR
ncbi:MAG: arsenite methyltransferase [Candidatus Dormibacteraceae bacterium]